ncbi:MAG: heme exporter protein CcmD [Nitrospirota bacterium]|nr:heme exporter protein CcmD [Nitrospirota bacterium]
MQWGSVSEFMAMGGYGLYVWTSFGVSAFFMLWEVFALRRRHAAVIAETRESIHDQCVGPR